MSAWSPRFAAALGLLSIAAHLGCSGSIGSTQSFDTPEACFASAKAAIANQDPLGFCDCITEESQQALAGAMVFMGSMMKTMSGMAALGGPQAAKQAERQFAELNAVLEKHGVTDDALKLASQGAQGPKNPQALRAAAESIADKRMFIAEMIGAMDKVGQGQGPSFVQKMSEEFSGQLDDLKIDGEKAIATLVGPTNTQPIEFRKSADGWKIHINLDNMNQARAPSADPA